MGAVIWDSFGAVAWSRKKMTFILHFEVVDGYTALLTVQLASSLHLRQVELERIASLLKTSSSGWSRGLVIYIKLLGCNFKSISFLHVN